jgi:hypothetical protein
VQTAHPGTIQLAGDTASGRAHVAELGRFRDGRSEVNYAVYHDRYLRTPDGWKFTERVYEVRYLDTTRWLVQRPTQRGRPLTPERCRAAVVWQGQDSNLCRQCRRFYRSQSRLPANPLPCPPGTDHRL